MRRLIVAALIAMTCVTAAPVAMAQDDQGTEPTAFEAADPEMSRHKENLSGIPFMVGAYLAIWGSLFGYLVLLQRKQGKVSAEIAELRRALEAHDRGGAA